MARVLVAWNLDEAGKGQKTLLPYGGHRWWILVAPSGQAGRVYPMGVNASRRWRRGWAHAGEKVANVGFSK